jgi:hypothetical protein
MKTMKWDDIIVDAHDVRVVVNDDQQYNIMQVSQKRGGIRVHIEGALVVAPTASNAIEVFTIKD